MIAPLLVVAALLRLLLVVLVVAGRAAWHITREVHARVQARRRAARAERWARAEVLLLDAIHQNAAAYARAHRPAPRYLVRTYRETLVPVPVEASWQQWPLPVQGGALRKPVVEIGARRLGSWEVHARDRRRAP